MHHIDAHQISNTKWLACVDGCYENIPVIKKRAVWIFDDNYKVPAFLSVASFRQYMDTPITLIYNGTPDRELIDMFKNLGGKIEFNIVDDKSQPGITSLDRHRKNRFLRMEIMSRWPEEQVLLFDSDVIFSEKIKELSSFIEKAFKNKDRNKPLVGGVTEDDLFYFFTAKRDEIGKLTFTSDEELERCLQDVYGDNWKARLSGSKFNCGMLLIYKCAELADVWKSHYLNGLMHPKVNHEDDQVPFTVAMLDLKTQVIEFKDTFNSKGKLSGEYAIYHAWNRKWKPELQKIMNGETNFEDYGIIALKHFEKIPRHWLENKLNYSIG